MTGITPEELSDLRVSSVALTGTLSPSSMASQFINRSLAIIDALEAENDRLALREAALLAEHEAWCVATYCHPDVFDRKYALWLAAHDAAQQVLDAE